MPAQHTEYFKLHKKILRVIGMPLKYNKNEALWFKIYCIVIKVLIIGNTFITFAEVIHSQDFDCQIIAFPYATGSVTVASIYLCLWNNRKQLQYVTDTLTNGVHLPNNQTADNCLAKLLIQKCVRNGNRMSAVTYALGQAITIPAILSTLGIRIFSSNALKWWLPFAPFSLFDTSKSPNFEIVWLYQSVTYTVSIFAYLTSDLIFISISSYIIVQYNILAQFIKTGVQGKQKTKCAPLKRLSITLKEAILRHNVIIDLSYRFGEVYKMILLFRHLGSLLGICCLLYHITTIKHFDFQIIKDVTSIFCMALEISLVAYWGSEVTGHSEKIAIIAYDANVEGSTIHFQKGLMLMMQRSQTPVTFSIGGISSLTLIEAAKILKTGMAYFMVLRSLKESK